MADPVTRLNAALQGRYAIEREIGEGGMATVYLANLRTMEMGGQCPRTSGLRSLRLWRNYPPTFDDPADAPALETLAGLFPGREVVGVRGLDIVKEEGCIHCITQQEPRP